MLDRVREAMKDLETRGSATSVREVRKLIGGGSMTDVGAAIRKVKEERDALNTVRTDLPQALQDKVSILSVDYWKAAQELANRAIEDVRLGAEARIAAADNQAREMLHEVDDAERRLDDLKKRLEDADRARSDLEQTHKKAVARAEKAEMRVVSLEAEVKVSLDHLRSRDKELEWAYASLERMTAALTDPRKGKASAPKRPSNGADKPETVAE
ncbi:DNA-binding protein [Bradyrhizobium sp. 2TAF36]|uniref:DNA-binding protein n=1 Tax=Bradyrhizobium sp. 2TAF36 TaxID=3233016 RepID=UPI003F8DDA06